MRTCCASFNPMLFTYTRMLRVSREIADLAGYEQVARVHVADALSYRRHAPVN